MWNFHRPIKPFKSHFIDPNTVFKASETSVLISVVSGTEALEKVGLTGAGPDCPQIKVS